MNGLFSITMSQTIGFSSFSNKVKGVSFSASEHLWSYLGKVVLLSRSVLNAAEKTCLIVAIAGKNFPNKVMHITNRLKLFSVVGVPFSVVAVHSVTQKMLNSFYIKDGEGVLLNTLSFTVITADIIDSITTFINASLVLFCANPIALFSTIGLPLAFTMVGLGTVLRTIQIAKDLQFDEIASSKVDLKQLSKKVRVNALGIAANAFMLNALTAFSLGSGTALPHVLKCITHSIRLGALYYQDQANE